MHLSTFLRNKFSILIVGIAATIYLINISNKESIITKDQTTTSLSNPKNNLIIAPKSTNKNSENAHIRNPIQNEMVDKNNIEKNSETQVPWEELQHKWLEDLKSYLVSISDKDGLRMFKAYSESREIYLKEDNRIGKKYQKLISMKPSDIKIEDQFAVEASENFKKSNERNKKIFGQHYNAVKKFYREYEENIQVYSRDMPISLDLSFED